MKTIDTYSALVARIRSVGQVDNRKVRRVGYHAIACARSYAKGSPSLRQSGFRVTAKDRADAMNYARLKLSA